MDHVPGHSSRTPWLLRLSDFIRRLADDPRPPARPPLLEEPQPAHPAPAPAPPGPEGDDFAGWDTMIMALMA